MRTASREEESSQNADWKKPEELNYLTAPARESALFIWRQSRREVLSWPIALIILEQAICLDVHQKSFSEVHKIAASFAFSRMPCWRNIADINYFSTPDTSSTVFEQAVLMRAHSVSSSVFSDWQVEPSPQKVSKV